MRKKWVTNGQISLDCKSSDGQNSSISWSFSQKSSEETEKASKNVRVSETNKNFQSFQKYRSIIIDTEPQIEKNASVFEINSCMD